jgi:hypothetical protein
LYSTAQNYFQTSYQCKCSRDGWLSDVGLVFCKGRIMTRLVRQLSLSYSQLNVFNSQLKNPLNNWNSDYVKQGFSWREKSLSFNTILDSGTCNLTLYVDTDFIQSKYIRAIAVPFTVDENGIIELGSMDDFFQLKILSGSHEVVFAIEKIIEETNQVNISLFINQSIRTSAEILIQDAFLIPNSPLLLDAVAA